MGSPVPTILPFRSPARLRVVTEWGADHNRGKSELRRPLQPAGAIDGEPVSRDRALRSASCMVPRHTSRLRKFSTASFS
jgi:hypothetical protein